MARITFTVPDSVAEAIRAAAGPGGSSAQWIADVVTAAVKDRSFAAAGVYDREHDDDGWEAERLAGTA